MAHPALGKALLPVLGIGCVLGILLLRSGFIFLLLAMLPAVMAYYMDHTEDKSMFKTVLACNFAATLPTLMPMLQSSKHYDIGNVMSTPMVWLFVYGGAAAGWCLIFLCRLVSRLFIVLIYEYKIAALERVQKKLVDEWGIQIQKNTA